MTLTDDQIIELSRREAAPWAERAQALAAAQVERQLPLLGELAEMGLEVARAVERAARAWTPPEAPSVATVRPSEPAAERPEVDAGAETDAAIDESDARPDPHRGIEGLALAYARVSRSVRLSIALQSKLVKDLEGLHRTQEYRAGWKERQARSERQELVARVAQSLAYAEKPDQERAESFHKAAHGWMRTHRYDDMTARPMSEVVAQICKDVKVTPNWAFLAEDAWARAEIASGEPGQPLRAFLAERTRTAEPAEDAPGHDGESRFTHAARWRTRRSRIRAGPS